MPETLNRWAEARGHRIAWYDGSVVPRVFDEIQRLRAEGAFDDGFFGRSLAWLLPSGGDALPAPPTVILAATAAPAYRVTFTHGGADHALTLPPTYHRYSALMEECRLELQAALGPGVRVETLAAPLKTLAVWTGFARYGRNNIAYVEPFGSACQLFAFSADTALPGAGQPTLEPVMLDACRRCTACRRACPTAAIDDDRFLLHAERCLTYFSEYDLPLPPEYGRLKTPCLVGCMACQEQCPANRGRIRHEHLPIRFDAAETAALLGAGGDAPLSEALVAKVTAIQTTECTATAAGPNPLFRRNLAAALSQRDLK